MLEDGLWHCYTHIICLPHVSVGQVTRRWCAHFWCTEQCWWGTPEPSVGSKKIRRYPPSKMDGRCWKMDEHQICQHVYIDIDIYIYIYIMCIYIYMYGYIFRYTHVHTHTYVYVYIYIYTYILSNQMDEVGVYTSIL